MASGIESGMGSGMGSGLADLIRSSWHGWINEPLEASVFGTTDVQEIAQRFETLTRTHLGAGIERALGYHASVGCTALVLLADGRRVAIKVHQPQSSPAFLSSVVSVQRAVHEAGFPAPPPLVGPVPVGTQIETHATVDGLLDDPGVCRDADSGVRRASAVGLATLVATARPLLGDERIAALAEHPMIEEEGDLWGRPHSPLFDFDAPSPHAARIDECGREALDARNGDRAAPVVAHADWTMRNVRIVGARLVAVFDWDSLAIIPETRAVGQAAQTWNATGEPGGPSWPDTAGVAAFVADYERARGAPFTLDERHAVGGAALYTLAYTARCEAALQARWPDHDGHPHHALDLLEIEGSRLLSL